MKKRLLEWGDTKVIDIATCLVVDEDERLLLLRRHTENLGGGLWGTPGGRVEENESPKTAALRELLEETGIAVTESKMLGTHIVKMPHGTVRMTSFKVLVASGTVVALNPEEHYASAWFTTDSLLDTENILWGVPSVLRDFGMIRSFEVDPTLADGSSVTRLN
jgi:8-oxo-dGTP diphosphatase